MGLPPATPRRRRRLRRRGVRLRSETPYGMGCVSNTWLTRGHPTRPPKGCQNPAQGAAPWDTPRAHFRRTLKGLDRGTPVVKPFQGFGVGHGRVSQGSEPWARLFLPFGVRRRRRSESQAGRKQAIFKVGVSDPIGWRYRGRRLGPSALPRRPFGGVFGGRRRLGSSSVRGNTWRRKRAPGVETTSDREGGAWRWC